MCHPVKAEEEQNSVESLRKRRSAEPSNPLAMLRRFVGKNFMFRLEPCVPNFCHNDELSSPMQEMR